MLRPIQDFVVIQRDEKETVTPGGIVVPGSAQEKVTRGTVLAVGPGANQEHVLADVIEQAVEMLRQKGPVREVLEPLERVAKQLRSRAPQVAEGDRVLFGKYTGNEVKVALQEGLAPVECIVTRDAEIYGVIE